MKRYRGVVARALAIATIVGCSTNNSNAVTVPIADIDQACATQQQAVLNGSGSPDSISDESADTLLVGHVAGINYWYSTTVYSFGDSSGTCITTQHNG